MDFVGESVSIAEKKREKKYTTTPETTRIIVLKIHIHITNRVYIRRGLDTNRTFTRGNLKKKKCVQGSAYLRLFRRNTIKKKTINKETRISTEMRNISTSRIEYSWVHKTNNTINRLINDNVKKVKMKMTDILNAYSRHFTMPYYICISIFLIQRPHKFSVETFVMRLTRQIYIKLIYFQNLIIYSLELLMPGCETTAASRLSFYRINS